MFLIKFVEEHFQLRNLENHISLLELVEEDDANSIEYGINRRSILMDLAYFDICQCLIPDVMHDILEGCLQYELKLLLQYLMLQEEYFDVSYSIDH